MNLDRLSDDWRRVLKPLVTTPSAEALASFLQQERQNHQVFPAADRTFHALEATPLQQVRCVILGQDPYHDQGQAHGLAFSVPSGIKTPPSLRNVLQELADDIPQTEPRPTDLSGWAAQGVLLLNTVLTVRAHQPLSHRGKGWEAITDGIIDAVASHTSPTAFLLWGKPAAAKRTRIKSPEHLILETAHPSPLSARRGFFGSRPFSRVNRFLAEHGRPPIDW